MVGQLESRAMQQRQAALSSEMRQFGDRSPFDAAQPQSASSYKNETQFKLTADRGSMQFDLEAPKGGKRNQSVEADLEINGVGTETPSMFNRTVRGIQKVFSGWLEQDQSKDNPAKRQKGSSAALQTENEQSNEPRRRGSRTRLNQNSRADLKRLSELESKGDLEQQTRGRESGRLAKRENQLGQQPDLTTRAPNGTEVNLNAKPNSIQFDLETSRSVNGIQSPVDIDLDIQGIGTRSPQAFAGTFREINNFVSNILGYEPLGNSIPPPPGSPAIQPRPNLQPSLQPGQSIDREQMWNFETPAHASEDITQVKNPSIVRKAQPLIGVIDSDFSPNQHGDQVRDVIATSNPNAEFKLATGVGQGKWAENLTQFVEAAEASGRPAVANLSFDLSSVNPDGSVVTRKELTPPETNALAAAQKAGIPVVVSAGNQGEASHAWQQAAQQFDNVIVTGAAEGSKRAPYSSYGSGLDILALGQKSGTPLTGTSLAAAETTATVANMLSVNPDLKAPEIEKILKGTATNSDRSNAKEPYVKVKPGLDSVSRNETGSGILNPVAAYTQASALEKMESEISAKTGVSDSQISVKAVEATAFPDSSLGQSEPGKAYLQVVTPGFNITLGTPEKDYQYKANSRGEFGLTENQSQKQSNSKLGAESTPLLQPNNQERAQPISGERPGKADPIEPQKLPLDVVSPPSSESLFKYEPGSTLTPRANVQQWQQRMKDRGWDIAVDGRYGSQSESIARKFQKEKGLPSDGIVGSETWNATFDTKNVTQAFTSTSQSRPSLPQQIKRSLQLNPLFNGELTQALTVKPAVGWFDPQPRVTIGFPRSSARPQR